MNDNMRASLERLVDELPIGGPRPGSNAITYITLPTDKGPVEGEDLAYMLRAGWLRAFPLTETFEIPAGDNDVGAPDVTITHAYALTKSGRAVLATGSVATTGY